MGKIVRLTSFRHNHFACMSIYPILFIILGLYPQFSQTIDHIFYIIFTNKSKTVELIELQVRGVH